MEETLTGRKNAILLNGIIRSQIKAYNRLMGGKLKKVCLTCRHSAFNKMFAMPCNKNCSHDKWEQTDKRCVHCRWYPIKQKKLPRHYEGQCVLFKCERGIYVENRSSININWAQTCPHFEWNEELLKTSIKRIPYPPDYTHIGEYQRLNY